MSDREYPTTIAARWWRSLQPYRADGTPNPMADRAALARLRRADLIEAMEDPATFALFRALGWRNPDRLVTAGLCTGVLALIRQDDSTQSAARRLSTTMSEPRFRRLIAADTPEERLIALRRSVLLAGSAINVRDVAGACLDWSDARRRRWLFDYHDTQDQQPEATP
jgi:CRISPR system Cascade subunit CasB